MNAKLQPAISRVSRYGDALAALRAMGGESVEVWYLGSQAERRIKLRQALPAEAIIGDLGAQLDEIADEVESDLLRLDEHLKLAEQGRRAWDASILSDLSPYVSDLQRNLCRFIVMTRRLQAGAHCLFLTDDRTFGAALAHAAKDNGFSVVWDGPNSAVTFPALRRVRARLSALRTVWRHKQEMRKARGARPPAWQGLSACDVIVFDWAESTTFTSDGPTSASRNLKMIPQFLRDGGHKVGFVALPIAWTQPIGGIVENVAAAHDPVVMVDECRSLFAVLRASWATWRLSRWTRGKLTLQGLDCSPIVALTHQQDQQAPQATLAYTFESVAKTLAAQGCRPKAIVYPYENQGWERALRAGVRNHMPGTRLVAYQFAPFAARYISFYPYQSDLKAGRLPDHLVCMGEYFKNMFHDNGIGPERMSVGGTTRFERPQPHASEQNAKKVALCSTSIKLSESLDLAFKCTTAALAVPGMKLIINFHPVVDAQFKHTLHAFIEERFGKNMDAIVFKDESSRSLLPVADVLLYNTSGAAFDALVMGKPAVYVPVDGDISYNKVPKDLSLEARDADALRVCLTRIIDNNEGSLQAPSAAQIGKCLGALHPEVFVSAVEGK